MWALLHVSFWLTLLLAIPAAGFLVRLFMIQHDCSHGAFFRTRALNDWVGRVIGVADAHALTIIGSARTPPIMRHQAISTGAASATSRSSP